MDEKSIKILIAGDSFAAPWADSGWPSLLSKKYNVTNLAQAGVSEYKIYQQVKSFKDYNLAIVSHTSPNRLHTRNHPIHKTELHKNCDLIYADIASHHNIFNRSLAAAKGWFSYHYDQEYQDTIYQMLRKSIQDIITVPCINLNNMPVSLPFCVEDICIDFSKLWQSERGIVNHYTDTGNQIVFEKVDKLIKKVYNIL